jgi:tRNA modification GTPase
VLHHGGEVLDDALVAYMPGPNSFTGEDVVELHCHGSTAVVAAVLAALGARPSFRMAEPGEFTRRALANGRMDLAQVEGLADLIEAETEAQRRQAHRLLSGHLGARVAIWRHDLLRALALLEASIDFADEDVPTDVRPEVLACLDRVIAGIDAELLASQAAERVRDGFEVAIIGEPNVGKSTLLNTLAGREAALTSSVAGTTRDVIEVRMDIAGLAVTLLDTAGLRDASDPVEALGIARARERAVQADLRVLLVVGDRRPEGLVLHPDDIVVAAKGDLTGVGVSGLTGQGVDALVAQIGAILSRRTAGSGMLIRARHRVTARRAFEALEAARIAVSAPTHFAELAVEDVRAAVNSLEMLVGRLDVEAVLGEIFSSFCIGK